MRSVGGTVLSSGTLGCVLFTANTFCPRWWRKIGRGLRSGKAAVTAASETTKLVKANCRWADILNLCLFIQQHYSFSVCACAPPPPGSPSSFFPSLAPSLQRLASSRCLPACLPVLTSHFLFPSVNINTGLMCSLQTPALEQLTAHIVGCTRHIFSVHFESQGLPARCGSLFFFLSAWLCDFFFFSFFYLRRNCLRITVNFDDSPWGLSQRRHGTEKILLGQCQWISE